MFKPDDMPKILAVLEDLSLGKLDVQIHSTDGMFFSFKDGIKGPFDELIIRTFTCALNTVLEEKKVVDQNKEASQSVVPVIIEKKPKLYPHANPYIWENISKIKQ